MSSNAVAEILRRYIQGGSGGVDQRELDDLRGLGYIELVQEPRGGIAVRVTEAGKESLTRHEAFASSMRQFER